jgi:RsmE family RNA methyltransferase
MNLIILTRNDEIGSRKYRIEDARAVHVLSVLKLGAGGSLEVGLVDGPIGTATIVSTTDTRVDLEIAAWADPPPVVPEIELICALPRPQTLKKILFSSAAMGVRTLHLIRANRVEKSYFHSPLTEPDRQLPFLLEGLSQGKSTRLPKIYVHDRFRRFFEDEVGAVEGKEAGTAVRLVCDPESSSRLVDLAVDQSRRVTIAIGPEGGWVPFEIELMKSLGFQPFRLGPWILRVEHAVVAALAQLEMAVAGRPSA